MARSHTCLSPVPWLVSYRQVLTLLQGLCYRKDSFRLFRLQYWTQAPARKEGHTGWLRFRIYQGGK